MARSIGEDGIWLIRNMTPLMRTVPDVLTVAGKFILALQRSGKLSPDGIQQLLTGAEALIKLGEHPDMTPEKLAKIVRIFANSLDQRNGTSRVETFLTICRDCGATEEQDGTGNERLPRHFNSGHLYTLLLHFDRSVGMGARAWLGEVATHIEQEDELPVVNTPYMG